ncbi:Uncharacterised protein [Vibrio cholerae]|nr:Uncharacterised protein [Vibrio cholerae]
MPNHEIFALGVLARRSMLTDSNISTTASTNVLNKQCNRLAIRYRILGRIPINFLKSQW